MRPSLLLAALAVSLVSTASAQPCGPAQADAFLENAGVRARLFNNGRLFWDGSDETRYEVPKGSGTQAMFAAGIWVGGVADGTVRFAGGDLGPWEYWPGPLAAGGGAPTQASCTAYDRIWRVTLEDIARYNTTGVASADLAEWPYEAGAPVVDGNGDPDDYDLAAGDRPAILGDETAWWVMNDRGGPHHHSEGPSIRLEVRVTAFTISTAYAQERLGLPVAFADAVGTSTLYRYALTYRGNAAFEDAYFGLWMDPELGDWRDDYVGSYPPGEVAFIYNSDDLDGGVGGYGPSPPALGVRMISGPAAKPISGFLYSSHDGDVQGHPNGDEEAYFFLQSRWRDGSPITYGGFGYNTGEPTPYMFPTLPPDYWSEMNIDGWGTANHPRNSYFIVNHGPFSLQSGDTAEISFALVFSRSDAGHLASVRQLAIEDAPRVAAVARALRPDPDLATITLAQLPAPVPPPVDPPEAPSRYAVAEVVWPNPTTGDAVLRLDLPEAAHVRLTLHDALGRHLAAPVDETLSAAEHALTIPTRGLPPGLYLYRLAVTPEGQSPISTAGRFTVVR